MADPLFWLGLSILLVAISLTAVLVAALPAIRELARAARSAEKLFDTLSRELPPTLESIRLTSLELSELTEEMSQGVQSAGRVAQQMDESVSGAKQQAKQVQITTQSVVAGVKAAWQAFNRPTNSVNLERSGANARIDRSTTPSVLKTEHLAGSLDDTEDNPESLEAEPLDPDFLPDPLESSPKIKPSTAYPIAVPPESPTSNSLINGLPSTHHYLNPPTAKPLAADYPDQD